MQCEEKIFGLISEETSEFFHCHLYDWLLARERFFFFFSFSFFFSFFLF